MNTGIMCWRRGISQKIHGQNLTIFWIYWQPHRKGGRLKRSDNYAYQNVILRLMWTVHPLYHDSWHNSTNYTIFIFCVLFIKYGFCWTLWAHPLTSSFISALEITSMSCKCDVLYYLFIMKWLAQVSLYAPCLVIKQPCCKLRNLPFRGATLLWII